MRLLAGLLLLAACAPRARLAADRLWSECLRDGRSEEECRLRYGCDPGLPQDECRDSMIRRLDIHVVE